VTALIRYLLLPTEVTPFEARYLRRMNKIALAFFWLHPPVFALVAFLAGTSIPLALALSLAAMIGPTLAYVAFKNRPRVVGMFYGITAMLMGGVLVYIGQGPMQIEMHFYFFVLIALLAVFGNPMVIIVAAVTVAAHHFVVWLTLPRGVFNYEASFWAVAVHAAFVVVESVAACFVARSFFDNVIGLEQIVEKRTAALDGRNRDMARILDNVAQGFVSVDFDGKLGAEWSRALERWFGAPSANVRVWDYLFESADQRAWVECSFQSLAEGVLPFELLVDQLPRRVTRAGREYRVDYQAVGDPPSAMLVVVSDITDEVARQRAESAQREFVAVVEKAFRDRGGFTQFLLETDELVRRCSSAQDEELPELKRRLHTLKGNTALFAVTSVSTLCHEIEDEIAEANEPPLPERRAQLVEVWTHFRDRIASVLGISERRSVVVDWDDYQSVLSSIRVEPEPPWAAKLRDWGKTPTKPRLEQCAEYARMLAGRLGKSGLVVDVHDHDVRLFGDQFAKVWPAFVHAIRNMVDHGIEPADVRAAANKPEAGHITLETKIAGRELRIEIADDGAGIDWERVAARAAALGLPHATSADLEEALFASGVSTAEVASDVSGRGVGMDALRAMCRGLGGRIEISSKRGEGTRFACVFPLEASVRAHRASISQVGGMVA
jgi:two-component system chemotaxis sensor kinase CheA